MDKVDALYTSDVHPWEITAGMATRKSGRYVGVLIPEKLQKSERAMMGLGRKRDAEPKSPGKLMQSGKSSNKRRSISTHTSARRTDCGD